MAFSEDNQDRLALAAIAASMLEAFISDNPERSHRVRENLERSYEFLKRMDGTAGAMETVRWTEACLDELQKNSGVR